MTRCDDSPESIAWQNTANEVAVAHLAALPSRPELQARIAALITDTRQAPLVRRGDHWFQKLAVDPQADEPAVVVRDSPTGEPRVLLDPNELSAKLGVPVTLILMEPSPDGRTLAGIVMAAGAEMFELILVDVATGSRLPDEVPWNVAAITWTADSTGLWCATRSVIDGEMRCPIYLYTLGTAPGGPIPAPPSISDAWAVVSPDGEHVAIRTGNTEPRLDWIVRDGALEPLLRDLPGGFAGVFDGDDLVVIADHDAPRGRLVRIPVATAGDPSTWTELVAESDDVLRTVAVVNGVIVLGYLSDASCRLRLLDRSGALIEEIPFDDAGTVSAYTYGASHPAVPMFTVGDDEISFVRSSFGSSWGVYRYVVSERRLDVVSAPAVTVDDLVVSTIAPVSSDGAALPTHVVHRADLDVTVPQPTLVYGYGGFNLSNPPAFNPAWAAWIEAGGVFVLSHLRGNSEFGSDWWHQGRREVKQQTFDDLYAIADHLIATGVTTSGQLAVRGESNGGLLTGAAIAQRPDLWAAVSSDVPILDLLGMVRDPLTYLVGKDEYGDPTLPEEAAWLQAISPVHNVSPADFPAVLVTAGANDPRCPVWHSRVFVDLVQQAQTGDQPILLRVYEDQGHGAAGLSDASSKDADWLSFVAAATGLDLR